MNKSIKLFMAVKNNEEAMNKFKEFETTGLFRGEINDMDLLDNADLILDYEDNRINPLYSMVTLINNDIIMSSKLYDLFRTLKSNEYTLYDIIIKYSIVQMKQNNHIWSDDELEILKILYPVYNSVVICSIIDRSTDSIEKKAKSLGLVSIPQNDPKYAEIFKLTRKYIQIEVVKNSIHDLSNTENVIDIMNHEYENKNIMVTLPEFNISRFAIKYFTVDEMIKYMDIISLASVSSEYLKPYQMMLYYTMCGRRDMFDYYNKNDKSIVKMFYKSLTYNEDKKEFRDLEKVITIFHLMVNYDRSIEKTIDNIEFFLNQVNLTTHEFLTVDKFIKYWDYSGFMKLLVFIDDKDFLEYVKESKKEGIPEYSPMYYVLQYKQKDMISISDDLNAAYSELLSDMIYCASDGDIYELFEIHSMLSTPFIIDNDLLQIMALSKYYSKIVLDNPCVLNENIDIENILHAFIISSMTNNISLAKLLFEKISAQYESLSSEEDKDKISDIISTAVDHFENYGTRSAEKLFVIQ